MKYTYGKLTATMNDWLENQAEYFELLAFVNKVFEKEGFKLSNDIAPPKMRQVHLIGENTNDYIFCVDNADQIYINDKIRGRRLACAIIVALIHYYSKNLYPVNEEAAAITRGEILDKLDVSLTLSELAVTSAGVAGGILILKSIFSKL